MVYQEQDPTQNRVKRYDI